MAAPGPLKGSLRADGGRDAIHPADVSGRFTRRRWIVFAVLVVVYAVLPWIKVGGHPAVFLDVAHREFYLFGFSFNAQDTWMAFFLFSGIGFLLFFLTTLLGRLWCGYACPQTVFLEGVYRRVERWIEGSRATRLRRNKRSLDFDKLWRKVVKHAIFVVASSLIAHVFLSYFVSLPELWKMLQGSPGEHPFAFGLVFVLTLVVYGNFAFFREQTCLIVCPYGRLQSVMTDDDSLIVGYDTSRGEPRGKLKNKVGDCVDCGRCVAVCPTGIDIRNGLQIDCIGCAACIDACDEIMTKVGRPKGLVRYDSLNGFAGKKRRIWRPRIGLYVVLGIIGASVAGVSLYGRTDFEAHLLRAEGRPYVISDNEIRNSFELHLVNKRDKPRTFTLEPGGGILEYGISQRTVTLEAMEQVRLPIVVIASNSEIRSGETVSLSVRSEDGVEKQLDATFAVPPGR